jgi:hypothetical protein
LPLPSCVGMSNNGLQYTDSVICYKELIDKEDTSRRTWKAKYGNSFDAGWRPVEPFERLGASDSKMELPSGIPVSAIRNPPLYRDTVGNEGLAGGTPHRFGGKWDVVSEKVEQQHERPQRAVKKGPHECYCDVGYNCWSMAGKARTANFGLQGVFEREFWTNSTPPLAVDVNAPARDAAAQHS